MVNCTYRGGQKTLDQTWYCHCTSDLLLAHQLKIPPAKNHALHYTTVTFWIQDSAVGIVTRVWDGQSRNHCSTPRKGKIFLSSAKHLDQPWGPSSLPLSSIYMEKIVLLLYTELLGTFHSDSYSVHCRCSIFSNSQFYNQWLNIIL